MSWLIEGHVKNRLPCNCRWLLLRRCS